LVVDQRWHERPNPEKNAPFIASNCYLDMEFVESGGSRPRETG
jgi:hypothetical protein